VSHLNFKLSYSRCDVCDEDVPALYDPLSESVMLFLPTIAKRYGRDCDELLDEVIKLINHESLHHVFSKVLGEPTTERIDAEHRLMKMIGMY